MSFGDRANLMKILREGLELLESGRATKAFNLFTRLSRSVTQPLLYRKIFRFRIDSLLRNGNVSAADELIEMELVNRPDDGGLAHVAAGYHARLGRTAKADRYYLRSMVLRPKSIEAAIEYSRFLAENKDYKKATGILVRTLRLNRRELSPDRQALSLLYLELAHMYYARKRFGRAAILYNKVHSQSHWFVFYDQLAESFLRLNRYEDAYRFSLMNLEFWGEESEGLFLHAKTLAGLGRTEEAFDFLSRVGHRMSERGHTLVLSASDLPLFSPLIQTGKLAKIENLHIEF